jgi:hypothetical protein
MHWERENIKFKVKKVYINLELFFTFSKGECLGQQKAFSLVFYPR